MDKFRFNNKFLKDRRKELRLNQTEAEQRLWSCLSNKQLNGFKFFRQYSVGPYILDFYCSKVRLAIELDGGGHLEPEQKLYDKDREKYLVGSNIRTIRFFNEEVENNIENVLEKISSEIAKFF